MQTQIVKDKIEFYINNTCNLNCDNCNRLNNYHFSGYDKWHDYESIISEWSTKVDFKAITILGGEPTLNPTLPEWVSGIRSLWPNAKLMLLTNGSRLKHWHQRGFFELLSSTNTALNINLHARNRRDAMIKEISSYLLDPIIIIQPNESISWAESAYLQVKDPAWPDCKTYEDFLLLEDWIQNECVHVHNIDWHAWLANTGVTIVKDRQDARIEICISYAEDFWTAPLRYAGNNQFQVYNSDPQKSHRVCNSKNCTHMVKGKIYKCHHVALLPEFAKQYEVVMTTQDKELMAAYQPLESNVDLSAIQTFMNNLSQPIDQCKLCPSELDFVKINPTSNKPKIRKIIPINSSLSHTL